MSRITCQRPKVRKTGGKLVATSDWRAHLWSLGFGSRKVVVDPAQKIVRIFYRRFWLARTSRRIQFDWVEEVEYGYNQLNPGFWAYQENDLFTVALKLKNGEIVVLFRFYGEGDFVNNSVFPDWFYWEDYLEAAITRGSQEGDSLGYADVVAALIGVPIGSPPA